MTYREEKFMEDLTKIAMEVAELRAENKLLKSFNDSLLQALHKPVVVRGGAFEIQSLHRDKDLLKHTDEQLTANAPTEPLESEGEEKCVCGDCGVPLTLVRPGKHQCDNELCKSNRA